MVAFPKEFEGAELVQRGRKFSVSVVSRQQRAWHDEFFAGGNIITDDNQRNFLRTPSGCPVLTNAVAYFDCRLTESVDLGDFFLAIGDVGVAWPLRSSAGNLTVNEIIADHDPRIDRTAQLPFGGFDFDVMKLREAPGFRSGPPTAEQFEEVYQLREWGLFFVSTADAVRGHFHIGSWMIQISHRPPRMAVAFKKTWEGSPWIRDGRPFVMTLLAQDQVDLAIQFVGGRQNPEDFPRDALEMVGAGLYRLKQGICWFFCQPESIQDVGDHWLAVGAVDDYGWMRPDAMNLTDQQLSEALPGRRVEPIVGFDVKASS